MVCAQGVDNSRTANVRQSYPQFVLRLAGSSHKAFARVFSLLIRYLIWFSADFGGSIIISLLIYSLLLFW